VALVDVSSEDPPVCMGVVLGIFPSMPIALIAQMDFEEGTPNARTRVVRVKERLAVGTKLDPRVHLLPVEE
jgi:hypothetical protein